MSKSEAAPAGIDQDVGNAFHIINYRLQFLENPSLGEVKLQSLPTFEEYMDEKRMAGYRPDKIKKYRKNSTPRAIAAYDALVRKFNAAIPTLENDPTALREYLQKFRTLVYGTDPSQK